MKNSRRIIAFLLIMTMMVAMNMTALAAPSAVTTGSISISNEKTGHTYEAYQLFDGDLSEDGGTYTLSNITWGSGVLDDMSSFTWTPVAGTTLNTAQGVADYLASLSGENAKAAADAFATVLKALVSKLWVK